MISYAFRPLRGQVWLARGDTRHFRDDTLTTIIRAELSSAAWSERHVYWITLAGLPLDFAPPPAHNHAEAIRRAADCGAFVTMLHPGLSNLPLAAADAARLVAPVTGRTKLAIYLRGFSDWRVRNGSRKTNCPIEPRFR